MLPKYKSIADDLRFKIQVGQFDNQQPLPTEQSIAAQYRVSRQTVRQALSVLVNSGLVEKRQGSGSYVRNKPDDEAPIRQVAVITTYISDYIFPSVLREVETVLSRNRCTPSLFATQNQVSNERAVLRSVLAQSYDGIIVEGTKTALPNPNLDLYQELLDRNTPLVFINGHYPELKGALYVLADNYTGGRQLVEHLVGNGHTRIGGIFKSDDVQGHRRYAGYAAALQSANLQLEDRWIHWYNTQSKAHILDERSPISSVLTDTVQPCSAVVCYNDEIASCLIARFTKSGVRVPEDIAVVSFDNSQFCEISVVPITSLSHGDQNIGRIAAEKLVRLMDDEPCDSELVPWLLVSRASG